MSIELGYIKTLNLFQIILECEMVSTDTIITKSNIITNNSPSLAGAALASPRIATSTARNTKVLKPCIFYMESVDTSVTIRTVSKLSSNYAE